MSEEQVPPAAVDQSQQSQAAALDHHPTLLNRLRSQVEFYFSPQNLARDTYLRNMLASEHSGMPTPRTSQFMCPVGVITNFPKVRDICALLAEAPEPPALLVAKALECSSVVVISSDGNWIGPALQSLPPPMMGGRPLRRPHHQLHFQQPRHFQQGFQQSLYPPNMHQQRMMNIISPSVQQVEAVSMQYQPGIPYPPHGQHLNVAVPISLGGSESPSSASLESMPSQQQAQTKTQAQQAPNTKDGALIAVMDLTSEVNPLEILTAFTTESVQPKSAFVDSNTSVWFVAFDSDMDAKVALQAINERTISGAPIHAKLNSELASSSKLSIALASAASLSSMSVPGVQMTQHQQQPVSYVGPPPGTYSLPPGPSPPPPMAPHNVMQPYPCSAGGSQYGMPSPMQPIPGMPPGQPYPPYFPPQQMQQVYPGNYTQSPLQQGGPQLQLPPYPHRMGTRFGLPPPPPLPPLRNYPSGPPPPYPQYQGMLQYMGDSYSGHYYPHAPREYNDRRQGVPTGMGVFHDHKKRNDGNNKKKKSKSQQYLKRESYGSGSVDNINNGVRKNHDHNNFGGNYHQQHLRNDNSTSPIPADIRSKWKKRGEYGDQFRRSHGHASPSFNRHYNRHPNDRLSSSDTTSSPSSQSRRIKANENRDIFSSSDFPGLGGSDDNSEPGNKITNCGDGKHQLVGYASALLKKKQADEKKKKAEMTQKVTLDDDIDSITRQTEEIEREILSEFHDLSLIGEGNNDGASSPLAAKHQQTSHHKNATDENVEGQTVGTASSSTTDARSLPNNLLPILPGPFPENDVIAQAYSSDLPKEQLPAIDITSSQDFPSREATRVVNDAAVHHSDAAAALSSVPKEDTSPVMSNDSIDIVDKSKLSGAWGSKRFADVI